MLLHALPLLLMALSPQAPSSSAEAVRLTVNAEGRPLGELLRQFAVLAGVERLVVDPRIETRAVTVKFDNAGALDAFRKTLDAAQVGYAIWGVVGPEMRIYVAPTNDDVLETMRRADAGELGSSEGASMRIAGKEDLVAMAAAMEAQNEQLREGQTDQGYDLFSAGLAARLGGQPAVTRDPAERAAVAASDPGFAAIDALMTRRPTGAAPDAAAFTDPGALAIAQLLHKNAPPPEQR